MAYWFFSALSRNWFRTTTCKFVSDLTDTSEEIKMTSKLFLVFFGILAITPILFDSCPAQESMPGYITSVRISPDLRQVVVKADGVLGKHSAFAFDKPYRLVVDFDSTALGKVSNRIRVEKGPISEIRLGKFENRARLVIDFGAVPVPTYAIERQANMAVIALGETGLIPRENHGENVQEDDRKAQKRPSVKSQPTPPKKEQVKTVESVPAPAPMKNPIPNPQPQATLGSSSSDPSVKKVLLSNDLLLVEFQDPRNPGLSYNLAIDIDLKGQTLRSASLSDLKGEVKRFEISEMTEPREVSTDANRGSSGSTTGPRKVGASNTVFENKPMEKPRNVFNIRPSVTSMEPPEGPAAQNPLKMEEFKLQVKKER